MYVDERTQFPSGRCIHTDHVELEELESAPDPEAGLYIKSRDDTIYKVGIPRDALAFQTGEGKPSQKIFPNFRR